MLTKNDLVILLNEIEETKGISTNEYLLKLYSSNGIPLEVLEFVNTNRPLELTEFYETLRKKYNQKKSDLYINIMKEISEPNEVLTTLASFNLQALIFAKKLESPTMFYRHARLDEVVKCLYNYYETYDLEPCIKLIKLIKADIKALEYVSKK